MTLLENLMQYLSFNTFRDLYYIPENPSHPCFVKFHLSQNIFQDEKVIFPNEMVKQSPVDAIDHY